YGWFTSRMAARKFGAEYWNGYTDHLQFDLLPSLTVGPGTSFVDHLLDICDRDEVMRERVRPIIADESKSAQFLAAKQLTLDPPSRNMFLDFLTRDFFAALALLARRAKGDYGPDKWAEQFPQSHGSADAGL